MRKPGEAPAFDRIIDEVQEARAEWWLGNRGAAERRLRLAAGIAYNESQELTAKHPMAEYVSR